jgi:hypothetical protein
MSDYVTLNVEMRDEKNPNVCLLSCLTQIVETFRERVDEPDIELVTKWLHESYAKRVEQ